MEVILRSRIIAGLAYQAPPRNFSYSREMSCKSRLNARPAKLF